MSPPVSIAETRCRLGESPVWSVVDNTLFWVDISSRQLHCFRDSDVRSWHFAEFVAAVAPCTTPGHVIVALTHTVGLFDLASGTFDELCRPDTNPQNRSNDARCDTLGRFWLGTMQNNLDAEGNGSAVTRSSGGLYCITAAGEFEKKLGNLGISNGIAWSPDNRTMYVADSLKNCIYALDFDLKSGDMVRRRIFHEGYNRGTPDGATVDAEGYLWSARFGGSCLVWHAPNGKIERVMDLPVSNPTSCTFGGRNLDTLFVTSATLGLSKAHLKNHQLEGATLALKFASRRVRPGQFAA